MSGKPTEGSLPTAKGNQNMKQVQKRIMLLKRRKRGVKNDKTEKTTVAARNSIVGIQLPCEYFCSLKTQAKMVKLVDDCLRALLYSGGCSSFWSPQTEPVTMPMMMMMRIKRGGGTNCSYIVVRVEPKFSRISPQ